MALETRPPAVLRFGTFEVDVCAGEVRKQGVRIKLQEQPFHVLTVLLQRSGEVVTREELRSQIWPADTFVDFDNSLNTMINKLREALGDSAERPRFIETLPRRGYRFIAPVTCDDRKESAAAARFIGSIQANGTGARPGSSALESSASVTTADIPAASRTRLGTKIVSTALAIAALLVMTIFIVRSRTKQTLTAHDAVVLVDLDNATGDPVFDGTLKQALLVGLEQSPFLTIIPDRRIRTNLEMMGWSADQRLSGEVAREACERAGGKALIGGSINSLGSHYVISLYAEECLNGYPLAHEQLESLRKEEVLATLAKAAAKLRHTLGESLGSVRKYNTPLEEATTPSLEALKTYSAARQVHSQQGDAAAVPLYKRAIELDADFAMAYAGLAAAYTNLNETAQANQNWEQAYQRRQHVTERERLRIASGYYGFVEGDLEKANQFYELHANNYPRDPASHTNMANNLLWLGRYDQAIAESRKAIEINPDSGTRYGNWLRASVALGHADEADATLRLARRRNIDHYVFRLVSYEFAFLKQDWNEMEREITQAEGTADDYVFLSAHSDTHAFYGHLKKARDLSRRAANSAKDNHLSEAAAFCYGNAALREAEFGNFQAARHRAGSALALANERYVRAIATLALARAGDARTAQKLSQSLHQRFPSDTMLTAYWLPSIDASIVLNRDPKLALEYLERAARYETGNTLPLLLGSLYPVYLRGEAYLLQYRAREAVAEYQRILDHRGLVLNFPLGALAYLGLARAYALQGDTAKSRTAYQEFFTLWKDADPDIPILKEAKAEYAKLQ